MLMFARVALNATPTFGLAKPYCLLRTKSLSP
jgi:hypothetical protein